MAAIVSAQILQGEGQTVSELRSLVKKQSGLTFGEVRKTNFAGQFVCNKNGYLQFNKLGFGNPKIGILM